MKRILVFAFALICIRGFGQQIPSQVQAKRGVFTDRLFLTDRWIDYISTNLNSFDSTSDYTLATGSALGPFLSSSFLQNQSSAAQPADLWIGGSAVIGSHNSYKNTLAQGWPSLLNVTHGNGQYGLSIQRASADQGPADIVLYKNAQLFAFGSYLLPLGVGDPIGQISFSGVAGDNNSVKSPMRISGRIEKAAPSYISSGFVFNTTDSAGSSMKTHLNAEGSLLIGSDPNNIINNYRLNVASGDIRFNSLADYGNVLVGCDNDGVLNKIIPGNGLYIEDGILYMNQPEPESPDGNLEVYMATLSQWEQQNPQVFISYTNLGGIAWTRDSVGHYTGTASGNYFQAPFTWMQSHPSDPTGKLGTTRLYRASNNTLKLVVKDNNLNDTDEWRNITIEIRIFVSG